MSTKMKKRLLGIIVTILSGGVSLWQVSFDQYIQDIKFSIAQWPSPFQVSQEYVEIQDMPCKRYENDDHYLVEPICLRKDELPKLEFAQAVDTIWPHIAHFSHAYDLSGMTGFRYSWTDITIDQQDILIYQDYYQTIHNKAVATKYAHQNQKIHIPKSLIWYRQIQEYTLYVIYNDTSMRKWCTLHNYRVALESLNGLYLNPGDIFNYNDHISRLDYCKGTWPQDLLFYAGACWAASQLFRTALLTPNIWVLERYNHTDRRGMYYGKQILWDDATIYQKNKELIIQNNDTQPIYRKTQIFEEYDYLVSIKPIQNDTQTYITRELDNRKTNVMKNVYHTNTNERWETAQFPSTYRRNYMWSN